MKFTNVRVFFTKSGNAKYISHLDLYRAFGRAVKRSGLPVWVTEGFNPHIYMTFALPLALGIKSEQESVDLRLLEAEFDLAEATARLDAVMPGGLHVTRVAAPVRDANDIERASYRVRADEPVIAALNAYFAQDIIEIVKKSKSKTRTLDVKPLLQWDGEILSLPAGNALNISPWNVLEGFEVTDITRTAILCADGSAFT